jgi:hypothetical protein
MTDLEDLERTLYDRLDAIGPAPVAVLLNVLNLPDSERARGDFAPLPSSLPCGPNVHVKGMGAGSGTGTGYRHRLGLKGS